MANIGRLNKIASHNSGWIEEAKKRKENRSWQKHSQRIAIKVLKALREKNIKQKQLAEMIGVSPQQVNKIVKGNENLTLQTIAKLEDALSIELIFKEIEKNNIILKENMIMKPVFFTVYVNQKTISQRKFKYSLQDDFYINNNLIVESYG